jgi:hypothetical protein
MPPANSILQRLLLALSIFSVSCGGLGAFQRRQERSHAPCVSLCDRALGQPSLAWFDGRACTCYAPLESWQGSGRPVMARVEVPALGWAVAEAEASR